MVQAKAFWASACLLLIAIAVIVMPLPRTHGSDTGASEGVFEDASALTDLSLLGKSKLFDQSTLPAATVVAETPQPAPDILTSLSLIGVVRSDAKSVAILAKTGAAEPLFLAVGAKLGNFELREISPQYVTFWDKDQRRTLQLSTPVNAD